MARQRVLLQVARQLVLYRGRGDSRLLRWLELVTQAGIAGAFRLFGMVVRQGMKPVVSGAAIGLAGAVALTTVMVSPLCPPTARPIINATLRTVASRTIWHTSELIIWRTSCESGVKRLGSVRLPLALRAVARSKRA